MKRRVKEQYQDVMKRGGNVTDVLNWLLGELSRPVVSYQYLLGGKSLVQPEIDAKLTARDLKLIRLTDGGARAAGWSSWPPTATCCCPTGRSIFAAEKCAAACDNYDRT